MAAAGILGALAGLGNAGEQLAGANQTIKADKSRDEAAQAADQARQDAIAERRRQFEVKQNLALAKKPIGPPYPNDKGQMVQRFYNPGTKELTVEPFTGGVSATPAPKPAPPIKQTPEEQRVAGWKAAGFTDEQIHRMEGVEGGLYARPGKGKGGGAPLSPADQKRAEYMAVQIAAGKAKYSDIEAKLKPAVFDAMMNGGLSAKQEPTATARNAAERAQTLVDTGERLREGLNDPEILKYMGPNVSPIVWTERHTGYGLPEKVSKFQQDLKSYGAFLTGLHPVKGFGALQYFDEQAGGLGQTPDKLRGVLDSNEDTVNSVIKVAGQDINVGDTVTITQ